jgi:osmotically-inducible protein OsmY
MSTASVTEIDLRLRDAVLKELAWDSHVDASAIGVAAKSGSVTLTGFIDSYAGKLAAERAAKRVRGVRAVANDVQVRLRLDRTDEDVAADVARALNSRVTIPSSVQAAVHQGHVTLTGHVDSLFCRAVAEKAVSPIKGVKEVVNRIEVKTAVSPRDIQREIARALHRNADVDSRGIEVTVVGSKLRLGGTVSSWREREAVERAASHASGIAVVDNRIAVRAEELPPDEIF